MCKSTVCTTQMNLEDARQRVIYLETALAQEVAYSRGWAETFASSDPDRSARHAKRAAQLQDILDSKYELSV